MYDNGLLAIYKHHSFKDGFLDASRIGLIKTDRSMCKATRCLTNFGPFYLKENGLFGTMNKQGSDAEILLSQLYNKAGIRSAVYLPAEIKGNRILLSNDVERERLVIPACNFIDADKKTFLGCRDFLNPETPYREVRHCYTPNAMKEQTIMRILDTAFFHTDRHYGNFLYELERREPTTRFDSPEQNVPPEYDNRTYPEMVTPVQERFLHKPSLFEEIKNAIQSRPNRADGVVAIDFESSGYNVNSHLHPTVGKDFHDYITDFAKSLMPRQDVLEQIRTNERLEMLVDKHDLAETIGSLNPQGAAQEIYETTGYEIAPEYTAFLSASLDQMAETLIK